MQEFYPFFIVIFVAVFFSTVFRRLHLPWVIALIAGGMVIGPDGFGLFEHNTTLSFIGEIGLVFLMFMAGLETKLETFKGSIRSVSIFSLLNGVIPFIVGFLVGYWLNLDTLGSLFLGAVFVSSSVAVIIPTLESLGLIHTHLGRTIVAGTVVEDIASLILVSTLLQSIQPVTILPLPIFYFLLVLSLLVLRWLLPRLRMLLTYRITHERDLFQQELRAIFVIMIGTVILFELLGLHPIIAGFFAGLVMSGSIQTTILKEKLRTVSYGVFIPVFFVLVGAETNISILKDATTALPLISAVVLGSVLSKWSSGWLAGRILKFSHRESLLMGVSTVPQLSTTLAVVFTGAELGFFERELVTAMVVLSIVTVFIAPLGSKLLMRTKEGGV